MKPNWHQNSLEEIVAATSVAKAVSLQDSSIDGLKCYVKISFIAQMAFAQSNNVCQRHLRKEAENL